MKKTLLSLVQDILVAIDGEEINSISDSTEATDIVTIIENVYYDMIVDRKIPEHMSIVKLTALSDSTKPTHFTYPTNTDNLCAVHYKDSEGNYREVKWMEPLEFLSMSDGRQADYTTVDDENAGTTLRIRNNKRPEWYTSFNDEYIIMDSYESTVETTLQESKSRAFGNVYPTFNKTSDTFVPDLDAAMFPFLLAEAKSQAISLLNKAIDPKVEQTARRHKSFLKRNTHNTNRNYNGIQNYGRN